LRAFILPTPLQDQETEVPVRFKKLAVAAAAPAANAEGCTGHGPGGKLRQL
jgi:hypothetical protein